MLRPLASRLLARELGPVCSSRREFATVPSSVSRPPSSSTDFNELRERSLLRHVIASSTEGDPESVMGAMDVFWDTYFNGAGTEEWNLRGDALDAAISKAQPELVLELGTYCGYSAVRIGRLLSPGAKLVSVEIEPLFAAIASKVVEHAGLSDKVKVEIGSVKERLPSIRKKYGERPVDTLMLDHDLPSWLPDVRLLEETGALTKNTVVLCDWNLYPGADGAEGGEERMRYSQEFMDHLQKREQGGDSKDLRTLRYNLKDKDVFTVSSWTGVV